jgi:serine/threonine protein kinase
MPPSNRDALIGANFLNYVIQEKLGEGGMGMVYRAQHPDLELTVAVKVMRPELAEREGFYAQFKREAQTVARLKHPNIVRVRNFGRHDATGVTFLMMDLVTGPTMRTLLRDSPFGLPTSIGVAIMEQVCRALDYAHSQGVLHLDLKPDNILLETGTTPGTGEFGCPYHPVISDFGLARLRVAPGVSVHTTQRIGTPHYMSPEQCRGESLNESSDIYSLGVMLYEVLTGQRPFPVSTLAQAVYYHGSQSPPPPSSHLAGLPASIDRLVLAMLAKDRTQRPPSAGAVADQLAKLSPTLTPVPTGEGFQVQAGAVVTPSEAEGWSSEQASVLIQVFYQDRPVDHFAMKSDVVVAGRLPPADLLLDSEDRQISKRHCEIRRINSEMKVRDLHSTNKTFLAEEELGPDVPTTWPKGVPLRLGLFTLYWGQMPAQPSPTAPPPEPEPDLQVPTIRCDDGKPSVVALGAKPVYIGRLPDCDMVIADPGVSKRHCAIFWDGKQVKVKDLGTTNGTVMEDRRLEAQQLEPWAAGTDIRIGPYIISLSE